MSSFHCLHHLSLAIFTILFCTWAIAKAGQEQEKLPSPEKLLKAPYATLGGPLDITDPAPPKGMLHQRNFGSGRTIPPLSEIPPPYTVSDKKPNVEDYRLTLDEAIRITLANTKVVRVLAGFSAVSSGRTIYDAPISNTLVFQERGAFDPQLQINNTFDRREQPFGILHPFDPFARIDGTRTDAYGLNAALTKKTIVGGTASMTFIDDYGRFQPGVFPLNPQNRHSLTMRYDQPLLKGAGTAANLAPIVIARINVDRSFFQFKDSLQESVRGVIDAYWALWFAGEDVKASRKQVLQNKIAYKREKDFRDKGFGKLANVVQAKSALQNSLARLVSSEAQMIQREAALRNIMGWPPADGKRLVTVTPPFKTRNHYNWRELVRLAEERRPDLIEAKLVIEADEQFLAQAYNQTFPKVDAIALYRWNGLEGKTPSRAHISTNGGHFTEWTLGVNFSLPLGLRRDRAALRQRKLILARDWANLNQALHSAVHQLATSVRSLAQFYEQYLALKEARIAATENRIVQEKIVESNPNQNVVPFLNLIQAIINEANAEISEAQALAQYNTELATLERETGTILETHGIYFHEERFKAIGPLGRLAHPWHYSHSIVPTPNVNRYPGASESSREATVLPPPTKIEGSK